MDMEREARARESEVLRQPEPDNYEEQREATPPEQGSTCKTRSPVQVATGNKVLTQVDFAAHDLALVRHYSAAWTGNGLFGPRWLSGFDHRLEFVGTGPGYSEIILSRPEGLTWSYTWNASTGRWEDGKPDSIAYIEAITGGYRHHTEQYRIEDYDTAGRILSDKDIRGVGLSFQYNGSGQLTTVTHSSGRAITFTWSGGRVATATAPDGKVYQYAYGGTAANLASVTLPDGLGVRSYTYWPYSLLAGYAINGVAQTWYDYFTSDLRAFKSGLADGTLQDTFSYGTDFTVVENALGHQTRYEFTEVDGKPQLASVIRNASANCPGGTSTTAYDTNGFVNAQVDFNGNRTEYEYNARGQLLERRSGIVGTDISNQQRTVYSWDATRNLLLSERAFGNSASVQREVVYAYYADTHTAARLPQSVTVCDGSCGGLQRTTSYSYTFHPNGLMGTATVTDPLSHTSVVAFDSSGRMTSTTNALQQVTAYAYAGAAGAMGWVTGVTTPDGLTTTMAYDALGRVTSTTTPGPWGDRTVALVYTPLGRVAEISEQHGGLPARKIINNYNALGFQTQTGEDILHSPWQSERLVVNYGYNALGQRISEEIRQAYEEIQMNCTGWPEPECTEEAVWVSHVRMTRQWNHDSSGYLAAETGNNGQNLRWNYDSSGNVASFIDSLGRVTGYQYDSHQRLSALNDAASGQTAFGYDALGRLAEVTAPNGAATSYQYNGFGDLVSSTSADSGTTTFSYDAAGRRIGMTAANGRTESYTLDALGRVTAITGGSPQLGNTQVAYAYDNNCGGNDPINVGRLCSVSVDGETLSFTYHALWGGLATQTSVIEDISYAIGLSYDIADDAGRQMLTYPGYAVRYTFTNRGEPRRVEASIGGGAFQNVVSNAYYQPYGPLVATLTHGNGLNRTLTRDTDGRLTRIRTHYGLSTVQDLNYGYNANDLITNVNNPPNSTASQGYSYDALSRLTGVSSSSGNHTVLYDANGNREFHTWGGQTDEYAVQSASNQVSALATSGASTRARSYTHDAAGNRLTETIAGNTIQYRYDGLNRLTERTQPSMTVCESHGGCPTLPAGTWAYRHDGRGLRTSKVQLDAPIPEDTRVRYHYGPDGLLHGETTAGGTTLTTAYIWLNGEPVGLIRNGTLYHVHSDHLGRPEVVTTASRATVWRARNLAWDRTVVTDSIGGLNLGFPGQYRDAESAQWYNHFRTYDSSIGRYTQADPIGLDGGMNLYLYANANPVAEVDPFGLGPGLFWVCTAANVAYTVNALRGLIVDLEQSRSLREQVAMVDNAIKNCPTDDLDRLIALHEIRRNLLRPLPGALESTVRKNIGFSALISVTVGLAWEAGCVISGAVPGF